MSNYDFIVLSLFGCFLMFGVPFLIALFLINIIRKRDIKKQALFELEVEKEKQHLLNNSFDNFEKESTFNSFFYLVLLPIFIILILLLFFFLVALFDVL